MEMRGGPINLDLEGRLLTHGFLPPHSLAVLYATTKGLFYDLKVTQPWTIKVCTHKGNHLVIGYHAGPTQS